MRYLLNSAVIVKPGRYRYFYISPKEAKEWLESGPYISLIGYEETAVAIEMLLGVSRPEISRRMVEEFEPGDEALVFRLRMRVNPDIKGKLTYEFVLQNVEIGILRREE